MKGINDPIILKISHNVAAAAAAALKAGKDVDLNALIVQSVKAANIEPTYSFLRMLVTATNELVFASIFKDVKEKTFRFQAADVNTVCEMLGVAPPNFGKLRKDINLDPTKPWWAQRLPDNKKKAEAIPSPLQHLRAVLRRAKPRTVSSVFNKTASMEEARRFYVSWYNQRHNKALATAALLKYAGLPEDFDWRAFNETLPPALRITAYDIALAEQYAWQLPKVINGGD